jgi:hypothetical protein
VNDYQRMQTAEPFGEDEPELTMADNVRLFIRINTRPWVWEDRIARLQGWYQYIFLWDMRRLAQRIFDPKAYREWREAEPPF